ncbi:hypothetical protein T05_3089 [Trichinella murrelli]|uniref:Uncharacterized protein n=1 Tax=Trichinella murrelli TaxID=144512 RepID=A0A0V0TGH3_9BILA|nr:hypothetical protein T05_3089 [Trichinella murrelli]
MSTLMSQRGTPGLSFLIIHLFGFYAKFLLQLFSEPTDLQSTGRSSCFTRSSPLVDTGHYVQVVGQHTFHLPEDMLSRGYGSIE